MVFTKPHEGLTNLSMTQVAASPFAKTRRESILESRASVATGAHTVKSLRLTTVPTFMQAIYDAVVALMNGVLPRPPDQRVWLRSASRLASSKARPAPRQVSYGRAAHEPHETQPVCGSSTLTRAGFCGRLRSMACWSIYAKCHVSCR
jgi:hypothetical protein